MNIIFLFVIRWPWIYWRLLFLWFNIFFFVFSIVNILIILLNRFLGCILSLWEKKRFTSKHLIGLFGLFSRLPNSDFFDGFFILIDCRILTYSLVIHISIHMISFMEVKILVIWIKIMKFFWIIRMNWRFSTFRVIPRVKWILSWRGVPISSIFKIHNKWKICCHIDFYECLKDWEYKAMQLCCHRN